MHGRFSRRHRGRAVSRAGSRRRIVIVAFVAAGVGVAAGLEPGCIHRSGEPPSGGAGVCGCVEVVVHDDLDYLLPRQVRRSNIRLTLEPEGDDGARGRAWIRVHTGRDGCFRRDGLGPGRYRVVKIQAFGGRQGHPGLTTPDLEFDLWESALRLGPEGVTAVPTAAGRLDAATFDLGENEMRYLGHFILEYQRDPFDEIPSGTPRDGAGTDSVSLEGTSGAPPSRKPACLTRMARVRGIAGEVYLSSVPVGTRLCVEEREEEAGACSSPVNP